MGVGLFALHQLMSIILYHCSWEPIKTLQDQCQLDVSSIQGLINSEDHYTLSKFILGALARPFCIGIQKYSKYGELNHSTKAILKLAYN